MAADVERREALSTLLARTAGAEAEEAALLAEAAEVETRRRAEVDAARAAGLPLPAFCRPAGRFPELRICMEDVDVTEDPGGARAARRQRDAHTHAHTRARARPRPRSC
jgi:hypothetical protein